MIDFTSIDYLRHGTLRQREAYKVLLNNKIIEKLSGYTPTLAGTIPINIDIAGSDLDILCYYKDADTFAATLKSGFANYKTFRVVQTIINGTETILANFYCHGFEIEIFGQPIPVIEQAGYRHMVIEHYILIKYGEAFRQKVVALKEAGYKTEPAFGKLLDLKGDPYKALLNYITD